LFSHFFLNCLRTACPRVRSQFTYDEDQLARVNYVVPPLPRYAHAMPDVREEDEHDEVEQQEERRIQAGAFTWIPLLLFRHE
jgi:hypothetical protein